MIVAKNTSVRDFVRSLGDEDLRFLQLRLANRLAGDLGEAVEFLQRDDEADRYLAAAQSHADFFNRLDQLADLVQIEVKRRY